MIRDFLRATIRLLLLTATALTGVAICLGGANPEGPPWRVASPPSYQVLDQSITATHGPGAITCDLVTGRLGTLVLRPGDGIDRASLSPWEENGRRQLVGIGWGRSGSGGKVERTEIGLVRMSLPDGEVLDRLILPEETLPVGAPTWVPDVPASVVYVGGDFRLYRVDFTSPRPDRDPAAEADPFPRRLVWHATMPGAGDIQFRDLSWPHGPRLGGRAVASLRFKDGETGRYTDWQLWWLEMNPGGTAVIAAGRLLEPNPSDALASRRLSNVLSVGGDPVLAYLAQRPGESGYQLRVVPIRVDPDSGAPHALEADSRPLAERCSPTGAIASPDGGFVNVVRTDGRSLRVERISIPDDRDEFIITAAISPGPRNLRLLPK